MKRPELLSPARLQTIHVAFIGTGHDAGSEGRSLTILVEVKRNQLPQMDPELVGALRKQAEQMIPKFPHLPKAATVGNGVTH